ncbi:unnamed protein product [Schistosoma curassoni]|uniref:Rab GTPase domain-containing protein n=1 Tax=Schistosoma curassoni TaxID=6186 RepID=A0A183JR02_9TREM|nr:unnamed protein product [Schistosoma curassoni]
MIGLENLHISLSCSKTFSLRFLVHFIAINKNNTRRITADEDEILSNFGIDSGPINKSFSNSIRRHTLQFTTSLFRKPSNQRDNPDNILSNNDDVNNHQSDTSSATINSMSIKNSNAKAKQSHELTDVNNNSKTCSSDDNNSSNSKTNGNSVKRTTVRRFPRQITQPHSNRLQYNQTSPDNSDQMLLVSYVNIDWLYIKHLSVTF